MQKDVNILIVEDEIIIANDIKMSLEKFGYHIIDMVRTGEAALKMVKETDPDLVLVDIKLNGKLDGIDITNTIQQDFHVPVIYITAFSNQKTIDKAKLTAPYGYITKPFEDKELFTSIEMALYKSQLDNALRKAKNKIEQLHTVAIKLVTCENAKMTFKETKNALNDIFGIHDFAFYRRENDKLVLKTEKPLSIFKPKNGISEGIVGKIFRSDKMCIYSQQNDFISLESEWRNIGSAIGCRIGDEDVFIAVSSIEKAFTEELAEMLDILFRHTNEALKRIDYENLLKKKAVIDPLTQLYNRLYYDQAIKYEVKLAIRYNNDIGFIIIDINNLKKINDEFGHSMGDEAIKFVASLLISEARDSDTIIRFGGDEYLFILPQTGKAVKIIEKRLVEAIEIFNKKSELPFPVTFAIGSSFWNTDMKKSVEDVIAEADVEMYADKRNSARSRNANAE